MKGDYTMYNRRIMMPYGANNRLIGGNFALPFVLGGLTGSLLTPSYPRPYPVPYPVPYPGSIPGPFPGPIFY